MSVGLNPAHSVLGGGAVLMACACGAAANTAKLAALAGAGTTTKVVHPLFLAAAAGLILHGLWRAARPAAYLALAAFAAFALGAVLTPPTVMTKSAMPWSAVQVGGAGIYLAGAALLGYAIWRAFPSPNPSASASAIGGAALATGCGCCMVTGAAAGMAVTAGANPELVTPATVLRYVGLATIAVGLFRLGGWRAAAWVPAGGTVIELGPRLLRLTGDWMVSDVNLRAFPGYLITVAGTGLVVYGFAVAYRRARSAETVGGEPTLEVGPVVEPA